MTCSSLVIRIVQQVVGAEARTVVNEGSLIALLVWLIRVLRIAVSDLELWLGLIVCLITLLIGRKLQLVLRKSFVPRYIWRDHLVTHLCAVSMLT